MQLFDHPDFDDHEQVVFASDAAAGLRAVIAIHDTALGPSLGGCRIKRYASDAEAVTDALRLSRGMTYKAALAGLPLGGGKSVVLADAATQKSEAMMRAMGRAVGRLGGRYIVAEDVGATPADMDLMGTQTPHVSGRSTDVGDPSPWTAQGVFLSLAEAVRRTLGRDDLRGVRVSVKGLGAVGGKLAEKLAAAGARLWLSDIRTDVAAAHADLLNGVAVAVEDAAGLDVDVYAPCALGGDLSIDTIPTLQAAIVCGAANNQLATPEDADRIAARGILYCPDYLVNAGGLISVARPALRMDEAAAAAKLAEIPATLSEVIDRAAADGAPTADVADRLAEARFRGGRAGRPA